MVLSIKQYNKLAKKGDLLKIKKQVDLLNKRIDKSLKLLNSLTFSEKK
jgi:hypothetical protein